MTIQTIVYDGNKRNTRNWRKIYKGVNLSVLREGFYSQEEHCKWGLMVQLKGDERIVIGRFGENQEGE